MKDLENTSPILSATPTKRRSISILSAVVILSSCLSYSILADTPIFLITSLVFMALSLTQKHPIPKTTRTIIYSLTLALIVTVLIRILEPIDDDLFFSPLPTEILFPFVISLCITTTFFAHSSATVTIVVAFALFSMMLQGTSVYNPPSAGLFLPPTLTINRFWIYGLFLSIQVCAVLPLLLYKPNTRHTPKQLRRNLNKQRQWFSLSMILVVTGTIISCTFAQKVEFLMEPLFKSILRAYMESFKSTTLFSQKVDLYRKPSHYVKNNQEKVVLFAKSKKPPGYLRGRVYTDYKNGQWINTSDQVLKTLPQDPQHLQKTTRRYLRYPSGKFSEKISDSTIDVFPSSEFYSDVILANPGAHTIEILADSLQTNSEGVLFPSSWEKKAGYTLTGRHPQQKRGFGDDENPRESNEYLLKISDPKIKEKLIKIGKNIFKNKHESPLKKVRALENFLGENYAYDLNSISPNKDDPILNFLTKSKQGHCELFASSAALLLRTQGIPTRYITGFVCSEPHAYHGFWVARLIDCHAWVEAWVPESGKWQIVETTPPIGIPQGIRRSSTLSSVLGIPFLYLKEIYSDVKRGYFAEAVLSAFVGLAHFCLWLFWTGPWIMGWSSVGILLFLFRKKIFYHRTGRKNPIPPESTQLFELYRDIQLLLNHVKITPSNTMTLRDINNLLKEHQMKSEPLLSNILLQFEAIRYKTAPPTQKQVFLLKDKLKILKKSWCETP